LHLASGTRLCYVYGGVNVRASITCALVLTGAACASISGLNQYAPGTCAAGCDESIESGLGDADATDDFEPSPEASYATTEPLDEPPDGDGSETGAVPTEAATNDAETHDASLSDASTSDGASADAVQVEAGALDAAVVDASDGGSAPNCTGDLSNIGTGNFRVSFTVTTHTVNYVALVNQRSGCTGNVFWDLRYRASTKQIAFEIDDNSAHDVAANTNPVTLNDGLPHVVVFLRMSSTLTVEVDGAVAGTVTSSNVALVSFGALSPLAEGVDSCDNHDGTMALDGTISAVCVSPGS